MRPSPNRADAVVRELLEGADDVGLAALDRGEVEVELVLPLPVLRLLAVLLEADDGVPALLDVSSTTRTSLIVNYSQRCGL